MKAAPLDSRKFKLSLLVLLSLFVLLLPFTTMLAQENEGNKAPAAAGVAKVVEQRSPMVDFLFRSVTGYILIATYLFFVGLIVWLIVDLRGSTMMPAGYVDKLEDHINNKQYKEAFELSKAEPSMFGRVMTAGMSRLSTGLDEARNAAEAMLESSRARKDSVLSYLAVLGTLGPLIGLVGTVAGMIDTFSALGSGKSPNPAELASGISHALNATLVGIFLSVLAIPAYSFFKNKLNRIVLDAGLLADDLLTQTYNSSKKGDAGSPPPVKAVPVPPAPTK